MPDPSSPARPPRAPGAYLRLPLWQRFALIGLVAVAALVGLVLYVSSHNTDSPPSTNPAADVQANRDAEILVAQDQAPRETRLPAGRAPAVAVAQVLRADVKRRIARGEVSGPLQRTQCHTTGPQRASRRPVSCTVLAGSVGYPFLAVVDESERRITYCKRDPPPAPSDNVPVSPRCRR
jgi:hypothetical protein